MPFRIHRSQLYEFRAVYIVIIMQTQNFCAIFLVDPTNHHQVSKKFFLNIYSLHGNMI